MLPCLLSALSVTTHRFYWIKWAIKSWQTDQDRARVVLKLIESLKGWLWLCVVVRLCSRFQKQTQLAGRPDFAIGPLIFAKSKLDESANLISPIHALIFQSWVTYTVLSYRPAKLIKTWLLWPHSLSVDPFFGTMWARYTLTKMSLLQLLGAYLGWQLLKCTESQIHTIFNTVTFHSTTLTQSRDCLWFFSSDHPWKHYWLQIGKNPIATAYRLLVTGAYQCCSCSTTSSLSSLAVQELKELILIKLSIHALHK